MNTQELIEKAIELAPLKAKNPEAYKIAMDLLALDSKPSKVKKSKKSRNKASINGAPKDLENVEVVAEDKDGKTMLTFNHTSYKKGKSSGYDLDAIKTAQERIEAKGEEAFEGNIHSKTGVGFVKVGFGVIGENLIEYAKNAGHLE